jgi:hypothetical protein
MLLILFNKDFDIKFNQIKIYNHAYKKQQKVCCCSQPHT